MQDGRGSKPGWQTIYDRRKHGAEMDSSELRAITLEAIDVETPGLIQASHPQIVVARRAAIKDLKDRLDDIEHSTRLSDKFIIKA
jgi:hypothetical protein